MHNSPEENLRFKIAFTETNIHWLLGAKPINRELIEKHKQSLREAKAELNELIRASL